MFHNDDLLIFEVYRNDRFVTTCNLGDMLSRLNTIHHTPLFSVCQKLRIFSKLVTSLKFEALSQ